MKILRFLVVTTLILVCVSYYMVAKLNSEHEKYAREVVTELYSNIDKFKYSRAANYFDVDEAKRKEIHLGFRKISKRFGEYREHTIIKIIPGIKINSNGFLFPIIVKSKVTYKNTIANETFLFNGENLISYNTKEIIK